MFVTTKSMGKYRIKINTFFVIVLFGVLTLNACRTPQDLVTLAIKRDPNVILCKNDTIEKIVEKEVGTVLGQDSLIIDNERIYMKVIAQGKIIVNYEIKEISKFVDVKTPIINRKPTRQEVRQQGRTSRKTVKGEVKINKQKEKTKRTEIRKAPAKKRAENKKPWFDKFWIGFTFFGFLLFAYKLISKNITWTRKFSQQNQ